MVHILHKSNIIMFWNKHISWKISQFIKLYFYKITGMSDLNYHNYQIISFLVIVYDQPILHLVTLSRTKIINQNTMFMTTYITWFYSCLSGQTQHVAIYNSLHCYICIPAHLWSITALPNHIHNVRMSFHAVYDIAKSHLSAWPSKHSWQSWWK